MSLVACTLYWYTALTYFVRGVLTDQNKGQGSLVNVDNKLWWCFVGSDNLDSFFIKGEPLIKPVAIRGLVVVHFYSPISFA